MKHGLYTREMLQEHADVMQLVREARATLKEIS